MTAQITLRLDFPTGRRAGRGGISILEAIDRQGPIAADREFGTSYKRARLLVGEMNHILARPRMATRCGARPPISARTPSAFPATRSARRRSPKAEIGRIEEVPAKA